MSEQALVTALLATIAIISTVTVAGTQLGKKVISYMMERNIEKDKVIYQQSAKIEALHVESIKTIKDAAVVQGHLVELLTRINGRLDNAVLAAASKKNLPKQREYDHDSDDIAKGEGTA